MPTEAGPPGWLETLTVEGQKRIDEAATARQRMIEAMSTHKPVKVIRAPAAGPGFDCQDCLGMRERWIAICRDHAALRAVVEHVVEFSECDCIIAGSRQCDVCRLRDALTD